MLINQNKLSKLAWLILGFFFVVQLALRLHAISSIPPIIDEPDDMYIIANDLSKVSIFFQNATVPDQARLPFFISAALLHFLSDKGVIVPNSIFTNKHVLVPLRTLFLMFNFVYIWVSCKLIFLVTKNARSALLYGLLLLFSCYLAGLSLFAIDATDQLYILFHITAVYFFWKSICHESEKGAFKGVVLVSVLIGLCTASKLFGIFLLPSFLAFHWLVNRGKAIFIQGQKISHLLMIGLLFVFGIVFVNIGPLTLRTKLPLSLGLSALYLAGLSYLMIRSKAKPSVTKTHFLSFWLAISLTAFCVTITFSPIYLNLSNIFRCLDWFGLWPTGEFVRNHGTFDFPLLIIMKYGLVSVAVLLLAIGVSLRKKLSPWKESFYCLSAWCSLCIFW